MTPVLNLLAVLDAGGAPDSDRLELARLTEAELMTRYPALVVGLGALVFVGLICDVVLCIRWLSPFASRVGQKPWGLREVGIGALALLVPLLCGGALIAQSTVALGLTGDVQNFVLLAGELVLRVAVLVALLLFLRRQQIPLADAFGFRAESRRGAVLAGIVAYLGVLPPLVLFLIPYAKFCRLIHVRQTPQPIAELFVGSDSNAIVWLIATFAVVVAPAFEELLFRGLAYPAFKRRCGALAGAVIVSVVFALIHLHPFSVGPLFVLALGLAFGYEMTGSLLTPITMHALFNLTNIAMLLYVRSQA